MDATKQMTEQGVIDELFSRYPSLLGCRDDIIRALGVLCSCWESDGKLLVCGNGGSAADSEHVVGELVKSFKFKRPVDADFIRRYRDVHGEEVPEWLEGALPALSLVSQTALSTAFSNDESAVGVFAQQVYAYGCRGDALLAISTSGRSGNVVEAAKVALANDMSVIALTGAEQGPLSTLATVCVAVPETETFKVQELHLPVYHALCAAAEARFF